MQKLSTISLLCDRFVLCAVFPGFEIYTKIKKDNFFDQNTSISSFNDRFKLKLNVKLWTKVIKC